MSPPPESSSPVDGRALAARLRQGLVRRFGVDTRALAAFRATLGALLLLDLLLRARYIGAFYTDAGVLPRSALAAEYPLISQLSVHALSGGLAWQAVLFALAGASALALAVGYRTRLATLASLLLLLSLQARNPVVLNAGDSLLRRLVLWGLLLPLGGRWSVDALRGRAPRVPDWVASAATAGLLVQVVVVYGINAAFKLRGDAWTSGVAVRYVFSLDQFTVLLGEVLAQYPSLLVAANYAWLALLVASPLLVVLTGRARTLLAGLLVAGHLGMLATMKLGVFPLVTAVALLPFAHPGAWDRVERALPDRVSVDARRRLAEDRSSLRATVRRALGRLTTPVAALALVALLAWNAAAVGVVAAPAGPVEPSENSWDMFAPDPLSVDGWYVAPARTTDGERVDAWNDGPVSYAKPPDVSATYPTARWRKYLVSLYTEDAAFRDEFAGYLCRQWNAEHARDLTRVSVVFVEQPTRLAGPEPTRPVRLATHECAK